MIKKKILNFNWSFTNKCNLKCLHCIADAGLEHDNELNIDEAKYVIDQLSELGCDCIHFTGGECLTRSDFLEVSQYAKDKGIDMTLVTNATLINSKNINIIKNIFNDVRISLNGANNESHDKIRGNGNFKKVIETIKMLNEIEIPLLFFVTVGNINVSEINDIIELCRNYNAVGLKVDTIVLEGRALNNKDMFDLTDTQVHWLIRQFDHNFNGDLEEDDICNISSESLYLSPDGNVFPCVHLGLNNRNKFLLGNIRTTSIEEMISKFDKDVYPICINKKCIYKFYYKGTNYILGTMNSNNKICLM